MLGRDRDRQERIVLGLEAERAVVPDLLEPGNISRAPRGSSVGVVVNTRNCALLFRAGRLGDGRQSGA